MSDLTNKQEKYVQELIKGKTQREAYKIAYPVSKKWKLSAVDTQASILISNSKVLERYNSLKEIISNKAINKAALTKEMIINELMAVGFANGTDFINIVEKSYFDDKGKEKFYKSVEIKPTETLSEEKKKAIAGIKQGVSGIELKTYNKTDALKLLGETLGIFKQNIDLSSSEGLNINIKKAD